MDIAEWETRFGADVCAYYAARERRGVTDDDVTTAIDRYNDSLDATRREARQRLGWKAYRAGPKIEWGTGGDPETLSLIQQYLRVNSCFTWLHLAWLKSTGRWASHRSLDGVVQAQYSFSEEGRRFEIEGLATWFADPSAASEDRGPVRGSFALDPVSSRLGAYSIHFLAKAAPDGAPYASDAVFDPPNTEADWLFVFRRD